MRNLPPRCTFEAYSAHRYPGTKFFGHAVLILQPYVETQRWYQFLVLKSHQDEVSWYLAADSLVASDIGCDGAVVRLCTV